MFSMNLVEYDYRSLRNEIRARTIYFRWLNVYTSFDDHLFWSYAMTSSSVQFNLYGDEVTVYYDSWPDERETLTDPPVVGGIEITGLYFSEDGDNWFDYLTEQVQVDILDKTLRELEPDEY